jgi:hypothetical protein
VVQAGVWEPSTPNLLRDPGVDHGRS